MGHTAYPSQDGCRPPQVRAGMPEGPFLVRGCCVGRLERGGPGGGSVLEPMQNSGPHVIVLGNPIAVWRDGKVCWLKPEEIEIPEEPSDHEPAT